MENRGAAQKGDRLDWVDVARGIGILAVVVGHVWTRGSVRDAAYSFHMPLFFLLSGFLSAPRPVGRFTRAQIVGQMRPYAAFLILLILADQIIETAKGGRPIFHQWPDDLLPILLGGSWLRGPFTIFWFVPCLMAARIAFNAVLGRWPNPLDRRWLLSLPPVMAFAYGWGWRTDASVLGLLSAPMAFCLLWAGAAWRNVTWRGWMAVPLGLLALGGLGGLLPTLNMKAGDYGLPLLSMAAAIATSLLLFRLARSVARHAAPLGAIGRASLVVMYLHVPVVHYLSPYAGKPWLLLLALAIPLLAHAAIRATPLRRIFL